MQAAMPDFLLLGLAALIGLCLGSFASLLAYRLPRGLPVIGGRSRCPACSRALGPRDLAPVLSYLWRRGRCGHCGAAIGVHYPLIELAAAALSVLAVLAAGPGMDAALLALLGTGLLVIAVVDLEFMIIPDTMLIALALLGAWFRFAELGDAAAGAAAGGGLAWALRAVFSRIKRREALGLGDVKFFAVAGIWCGLGGLAGFMLLSGIFGILFALGWKARGRTAEFPFAPALAAGLFAMVALAQNGISLPP